MYDILSLFSVLLHPHVSMTHLRQFSCAVFGLLAMTDAFACETYRDGWSSSNLKINEHKSFI